MSKDFRGASKRNFRSVGLNEEKLEPVCHSGRFVTLTLSTSLLVLPSRVVSSEIGFKNLFHFVNLSIMKSIVVK